MDQVRFKWSHLRCRTKLGTFFCFLVVALTVCVVLIASLLVYRHTVHNDPVRRKIVGAWHAPSVDTNCVCVFFADGTYRFDNWEEFCAMIGNSGEIIPPDKNDGYWRIRAGKLLATTDELVSFSRRISTPIIPVVGFRKWGTFGYFYIAENRLTLDDTADAGCVDVWIRVSDEEIMSKKKSESTKRDIIKEWENIVARNRVRNGSTKEQ